MRLLLTILCGTFALAEELTILNGGGIALLDNLPGHIAIRTNPDPAAVHVLRVEAISRIILPRPDRPGDVTVLTVPLATDVLKVVIPVRVQDPTEVLKVINAAQSVRVR